MIITVLGGTHGNEKTGIDLVSKIENEGLAIETFLVNKPAINERKRFVDTDINRTVNLPMGENISESKALEILKSTIRPTDVVIDFHNTTAKNNTCIIVIDEPTELHIKLAGFFGVKNILYIPSNNSVLNLYDNLCNVRFAIEISNDVVDWFSIDYFYKKLEELEKLSLSELDNKVPLTEVKIFEYVSGVKKDVKLNFSVNDIKNFEKIPNTNDLYFSFYGEVEYKDLLFQTIKKR